MKRIYVAGPYSGPDVITILGNMRRGMEACAEILRIGYAPFCPWFDYQYALFDEPSKQALKDCSMAWLEAADAVVVLENSENSKGVQAEVKRANELGIPVYPFEDFVRAAYGMIRWRVWP